MAVERKDCPYCPICRFALRPENALPCVKCMQQYNRPLFLRARSITPPPAGFRLVTRSRGYLL